MLEQMARMDKMESKDQEELMVLMEKTERMV